MSNPEEAPQEILCRNGADEPDPDPAPQILIPREVPLGGPRAMDVRRTLPQRHRSLIGPWCFLDHYGPRNLAGSPGMSVPRHPHTGLQTVSWLFSGGIEHRDSSGAHAIVRPGELNLMTAGAGISHSEFSTAETTVLHGAQLWIALPDAARAMAPGFDHYRPEPVSGSGWTARVFIGSLLGESSPVATHSPLVGVEILLEAGGTLTLDTDPRFEYGVLLDSGTLELNETNVPGGHLAYVPPGAATMTLRCREEGARLLLIGGEPLGEQIVMWWNFVGRSHEEIVRFRALWQDEIDAGKNLSASAVPGRWAGSPHQRFGPFSPHQPPALPAPALPHARMKPRG